MTACQHCALPVTWDDHDGWTTDDGPRCNANPWGPTDDHGTLPHEPHDFTPGQAVVYRPRPFAPAEDGTVVSTTPTWVHVLYRGDTTPKATRPHDLQHLAATAPTADD